MINLLHRDPPPVVQDIAPAPAPIYIMSPPPPQPWPHHVAPGPHGHGAAGPPYPMAADHNNLIQVGPIHHPPPPHFPQILPNNIVPPDNDNQVP